ncbi:unnamed protein product [Clonostachys chloroleuca]|uniref:SPX domain-containing protein n=1 Tax=Clonostachys chloroleuca TaxID=1926264 RepID=A0AA35QDL2_9HYPO|nr:unnamed protein product [Clonostachys chloroleuca]
MKFGEQLEQQSVPQWSLHNLDYNSLKHEIKAHTTRDQAAAIAIPGHQDSALSKFEDGLFRELCRQHDRVDLFVSSKADEVSRRLDHLSGAIQRLIRKHSDDSAPTDSIKYHRRLIKYERELYQCGDDIHALSRFGNAQIVAFRKIIKKYKKWTGSTTLGARFNETILNHPKSFTRRDNTPLRFKYQEILSTLQRAYPNLDEFSSPSTIEDTRSRRGSAAAQQPQTQFEPLPPPQIPEEPTQSPTVRYWNEYDDGSEAGTPDDEYAIYINPYETTSFPGLDYLQAALSLPFEKAKQLFHRGKNHERSPLLTDSRPTTRGYGSMSTDSDEDGGYASSSDFPTQGYAAYYAFPSIGEQKNVRYRSNFLFWGTISCFLASFLLLAISGVLVMTGRHKLRVEVDAAAAVGVVMSLFFACAAVAMSLYRRDPLSISHRLVIGSCFIASCILNGMLLVIVASNTP